MKFLIVIALMLSLVGIAAATDYVYILDDRDVYVNVVNEPGVNPPVIVDCQNLNNIDPMGCVIATYMNQERYLVSR